MDYNEEQEHMQREIQQKRQVYVNGVSVNLQPAFDVLKEFNLSQYISEEERERLGVR